ncbi:MAG TPA: hypothetical protein VF054_04905 [Micromonosporaceae bacterium]
MVTELRVHGVSGARPEEVLDRPLVYRVAGDSDAGFFRPRPEYNASTGPGGAKLEAYRWGNLTAGAAARAFWLLLLPFMLANVACWLRPSVSGLARALVDALSRIFALTLTATFVLSVTGVSVDLIGWQCTSPGSACAQRRSWLTFLTAGFFAPTGRRLAVLAAVPALAIAVLWFLARRTWARYEAYQTPSEAAGTGLGSPAFWRGKALVGRLRSIHIAVALGTLDAVLLGVLAPRDARPAEWALLAVALGVLLVGVVLVCVPAIVDRDRDTTGARRVAVAIRLLAVALTVATFVVALLPRAPWPTSGGLPGFGTTVTALFAGQGVLLLLLALTVLVLRDPDAFLGGLAGPVVASLALALSAAFSAGLSYRVADYLDRSTVPSAADTAGVAAPLQPPASYAWSAFGAVVALAVIGLVALGGWLITVRRLRGEARATTDAEFPGGRSADPGRASAIDNAIADGRLTDHLAPLVAWAYLPLTVAAAAVTGLALAGRGPVDLAPAGSRIAVLLSFVTNLGTYIISLAALGLVLLGLQAYRNQGVRRIVGIAWDLGTFWPRAAHPLAPPCYAERAVPELVARATWLASDAGGGGVVLSGHSQGSVLVAAAVLQLPEEAIDRVALLTYGSPIRRLYCRFFPAYVNPDVIERIGDRLAGILEGPRWVNLWRPTDPIGGWIADPKGGSPVVDDRQVRDPGGFAAPPGDTAYPVIFGHFDYQSTPEFAVAVTDLVARL